METFDLSKLTQSLVDSTNSITSSDLTDSEMTNQLEELSKQALKDMNFVYSNINTLNNKLGEIRLAISSECPKHHAFDKSIKDAKKNNPWIKQSIDWSASESAQVIAVKIREMINKASDMAEKKDHEKDHKKRDEWFAIVNELKKIKVFSEPYYHLKLSKEKSELRKTKAIARTEEKAFNQILIGKKQMIKLTEKLLNSDNHYELALGLALATGRRFSEIFYSAKFSNVGDFKVNFYGHLKKSTEVRKDSMGWIYTSVPAENVIKAFAKFRSIEIVKNTISEVEETNDKTILNKKFNKTANKYASRYLTPFLKTRSWKFSDSRAIWLRIVHDQHINDKEWKNYSSDAFCMFQLGHENLATQMEYKTFELVASKVLEEEAIVKSSTTITLELLAKMDDEILENANSDLLGFKAQLLFNAHFAVQEHIEKYGAFTYRRSKFALTKRKGGIGMVSYVAKKYVSIIEKYI